MRGWGGSPAGIVITTPPAETWLRVVSVVGGMACSLMMFWTLSSLGRNLTDTVVAREHATLRVEVGRRLERAVFGVAGAGPEDVIGIPLARRTHGVGHWRRLLVDRTGLAIGSIPKASARRWPCISCGIMRREKPLSWYARA